MQPVADWVGRQLGQPIVRVEPLVGGLSSTVVRCWLEDGTSVVARHITDAEWLRREPNLIPSEALVLELVTKSPNLIVPRHLVHDAHRGMLAMSLLPGEMVVSSTGLAACVESFAAVAARIHDVLVPEHQSVRPWTTWAPSGLEPPPWGDQDLWKEAANVFARNPEPATDRRVLLHRDFHPLNVLWHDGDAGVVDWVNACVGHPHAELGHMRWNLAVLAGLPVADDFLRAYLDITDSGPYDSWWDLSSVLGLSTGSISLAGWHAVGRTDLTPASVIASTEALLSSAIR